MLTSQAIELAREIATSAHRHQLDKIGAPYIEHAAQVVFLAQLDPATRARLEARYSHALAELDVDRSVITALNELAAAQRAAAGAGD